MKKNLLPTNMNLGLLILRTVLGLVIFAHGAQKLLGWFGGYGFKGTMHYFTEDRELPWVIGFLVILIEFFGALAILIGFATRLAGFAIMVVMTGVIFTTFSEYFFMNWFGTHKAEGYEFFLLTIGMSLSLVLSGAGSYSVDAWLQHAQREKKQRSSGAVHSEMA